MSNNKANELVIADATIEALDKAAEAGLLAQNQASQFRRMAMVAGSIKTLRNILTPEVMRPIMELQNNPIGFLTDNQGGYNIDTVRDCLIEATLSGVFPVGNEFNIISGRCYITKAGFFHKLKDFPNFTWIETPDVPQLNRENTGAMVKVHLEWTLNKNKFERTLNLAIRVNRGMGPDAIIGKAIRKARAWLWTTITGQEVPEGESSDAVVIDAEVVKGSPFESKPETPAAAETKDELPM